jgi:hypothetical protein
MLNRIKYGQRNLAELAPSLACGLILAVLCPGEVASQTLCPDGSYVDRGPCQLCPDGSYIGGGGRCQLTPKGNYTRQRDEWSQPQLTPRGNYIEGGSRQTILCPDGNYVSGRSCQLTPDGTYIGID